MFARLARITLLIPLVAATALAAAPLETVSREVSHAGLDLTRPAGMAILDHRIGMAAREICRDEFARYAGRYGRARRCHAAAVANARPQVERARAVAMQIREYAGATPHMATVQR